MKKIITMILVLGMTVGLITGCGGNKQTEPVEESVELTVFAAASMTETLTEIAKARGSCRLWHYLCNRCIFCRTYSSRYSNCGNVWTGYLSGSSFKYYRNGEEKTTSAFRRTEAKILSENLIYAKDWDLKLYVPEMPVKIKYVGIRMHDIEISSEFMQNSFMCDVKNVIENPFSYTIMVSPEGKNVKKLIGVELEKYIWEEIEGDKLPINIPTDTILLLEE